MIPPKPNARPRNASFLRHFRLFRRDILSAQPAHLFSAWMAEFKTPFFRSFLVNDPKLVDIVLKERARDFPKSGRITRGLTGLLGQKSVFLTNGAEWQAQRRLLDPAFAHGRVRDGFGAMRDAVQAAVLRLEDGPFEAQSFASHLAADVIFRTLFSVPITDERAAQVYAGFQAYQRRQPIVNAAAFLPLLGRLGLRRTGQEAKAIRTMISEMVATRLQEIAAGTAPDDLATRIASARDPETGRGFDHDDLVDQVAIFFLAGHETSASALAWALYLVARDQEVQGQLQDELDDFPDSPDFSDLSKLSLTKSVFQETLRLYPPVPMMVREAACPARFRGRGIPKGAQIVLSPWHLHRHERLWEAPDAFCPARFGPDATPADKSAARAAYMPFSAGPRVCVGAAFAMTEGVLSLAMLSRAFAFQPCTDHVPQPSAQLTLRSANGIHLVAQKRVT